MRKPKWIDTPTGPKRSLDRPATVDTLLAGAPEDCNTFKEVSDKISVINVTYSELKELRDNSKLFPGQTYRIIDYKTTSTQDETRALDHVFDILVTATEINKLAEVAKVAHHEGDTYFAQEPVESWEIKYCLDNDTTRFLWADEVNGKGVIWYMKDQFSNECGYDFKNIQILRDEAFNEKYYFEPFTNSQGQTVYYHLTAPDYYYFTFTYIDAENQVYDMSLMSTQNVQKWECVHNKILGQLRNVPANYSIPLNVFVGNIKGTTNAKGVVYNVIEGYSNTFGGRNVANNIFSPAFVYSNFFADCGYTQYNVFQGPCFNNVFKGSAQYLNISGVCRNNNFNGIANTLAVSGNFSGNTIVGNLLYMICSGEFLNNEIGGDVEAANISGLCSANHITNYMRKVNIFGQFDHNTISNQCSSLTVTGRVQQNQITTIQFMEIHGLIYNNVCQILAQSIIGMSFQNNTLNQNFINNVVFHDFTNNTVDCYFRDCIIENKVQYTHFNGDATQVNNYRIASGLHGTKDALLEVTPKTGATTSRILVQKEDGTVLDYCEAEHIETMQKLEERIAALESK